MNSNLFTKYHQALELKELGYDEPCIAFYELGNKQVQAVGVEQRYNNPALLQMKDFCAPLYQQAFKFLQHIPLDGVRVGYGSTIPGPVTLLPLIHYNKYEIHVVPFSKSYSNINGEEIPDYNVVYKFKGDAKSFDDAKDACLDKLIELIKNK